jgi:hypothetical protein
MNVLILNAFGEDSKGQKKFEEFQSEIKKAFKSCTEKTIFSKITYIVKNCNEIDDLVKDLEELNIYNSPTNDIFDKIDFIFIDGYEKYLPWKDKGAKLRLLLKLSMIKGKNLFLSGVGMQHLIFCLATNFLPEMNLINSNGEIKSIEDINTIPKYFLKNLTKSDYFLDYVTGDLYQYRIGDHSWSPVLNIGLHKHSMTEKYAYRGKFVQNNNIYRPKSVSKEILYKKISNDLKIYIQKQFSHNNILMDVSHEFFANITNKWFSHNFSLKNKNLIFSTLASSAKGSMIIEHENTIGTAFHIDKRYNETIVILKNFITTKFEKCMREGFSFDKMIANRPLRPATNQEEFIKNMRIQIESNLNYLAESYKTHKGGPVIETKKEVFRPSTVNLANNSRNFNKEKNIHALGNHVGIGFTKRDMVFVDNNCVNERPVSAFNDNTDLPMNRPGSPFKPVNSFAFYLKNAKVNKEGDFNIPDVQKKVSDNKIIMNTELSKSKDPMDGFMKFTKLSDLKTFNRARSPTSRSPCSKTFKSTIDTKKTNAFNNENEKPKAENFNTFSVMFPYVREEEFPKPSKAHVIGSVLNKGKEVIRVDLQKKSDCNYNRLFKQYEKELNTYRDVIFILF